MELGAISTEGKAKSSSVKLVFSYLHGHPLCPKCKSAPFIAIYIPKLSIFLVIYHLIKVRKHGHCSFFLKNHTGLLPVQSLCHLLLTCPPFIITCLPRWQHVFWDKGLRHLTCFSFHSRAVTRQRALFFPP